MSKEYVEKRGGGYYVAGRVRVGSVVYGFFAGRVGGGDAEVGNLSRAETRGRRAFRFGLLATQNKQGKPDDKATRCARGVVEYTYK